MKKSMLLAVMAVAANLSFAGQKTVTFDFSDPTVYGYAKPETSAGTNLEVGESVTNEEVSITVVTNGATSTRFYNSVGTIALRMTSGCSVSVSASGHTITGIEMTGANLTASNLGVSTGSLSGSGSAQVWSGSTETLTLTRNNGSLQFFTMAVTFEADVEQPSTVVESYTAITADGFSTEFANSPEPTDGTMTVTFGTDNVEAVGVAGTTPVDVQETETGVFPGWSEWNTPNWGQGNVNLVDVKPGIEVPYIYYVTGTGNPAVEINAVQITTDGNPTGKWKADYVYYEADGSKGLPVMGLYYKFTVKQSGTMKFTIWSNKGSRKTFVVDEDTKQAIPYTVEGYINGQNETLENVVMKDINGADSIGTMSRKRFLTYEEIQALHNSNNSYVQSDTTFVDATKTGEERIAADNIASITVTDLEPWIIGAGNQAFWGWLTVEVEAGKTYWLFQHSSQIGFGGYEFTYAADPAGIEELASDKKSSSKAIFDLTGRRASALQSGKAYIVGGKTVIIR